MFPFRERDGPDEYRPHDTPVRTTHLTDALANLADRVREQIAGIVGSAVASAVQQAVRGYLDRPPVQLVTHQPSWDDHDRFDDDDRYDDDCYNRRPEPPQSKPAGQLARLTTAVAAGWQASRWWARKTGGASPAWLSVGVGAVAGLTTYAVRPLALLAASAFAVLALADGFASAGWALTSLFGC